MGGISATFSHQDLNTPGADTLPWRDGDICVKRPEATLGRAASSGDPLGHARRLTWYAERTVAWVRAAADGTLTQDGDPFESPQFKPGSLRLAYIEDDESFRCWDSSDARYGLCDIRSPADGRVLHVTSFADAGGHTVCTAPWGTYSDQFSKQSAAAMWVRLDTVPVLPPYQAPVSWMESRTVLQEQGFDFPGAFAALADTLRSENRPLLLIGFPIPAALGAPPVRYHWQPILLPELATRQKPRKGFSARARGLNCADLSLMSGSRRVQWQASRNWELADRARRGVLPSSLVNARIAVIGCGALGSAVAMGLARAGALDLTVFDSDTFAAGNLVRHTLEAGDVGQDKAARLARQLAAANPNATVEAEPAILLPADVQKLDDADLIIDCTASDSLLHLLAIIQPTRPARFACLSIGMHAKRFYCFTAAGDRFPLEAFHESTSPWLTQERNATDLAEFPWEGIGCWHPVFPARYDDLTLFACAAIKQLTAFYQQPDPPPALIVFEQSHTEDGFQGLVRVGAPA